MTEPWHYTTFVDFVDHWQALIAGVLGFAAAIIVVWMTLGIERRKADRELDALRKSLGVEFRVILRNALTVRNALLDRVEKNRAVTGSDMPYIARLNSPTIYPAIADRIGLLGPDAMRVVATYAFIENARGGITTSSHFPNTNIPSKTLIAIANTLLSACENSVPILQKFKLGDPNYDEIDSTLIERINVAVRDKNKTSVAEAEAS